MKNLNGGRKNSQINGKIHMTCLAIHKKKKGGKEKEQSILYVNAHFF